MSFKQNSSLDKLSRWASANHEARNELAAEPDLLRQTWTGRKSDYWESPAVLVTAITNIRKLIMRQELAPDMDMNWSSSLSAKAKMWVLQMQKVRLF